MNTTDESNTPRPKGIAEAIKQAGSQCLLAESLGVTQQSISIWARRGWVPLRRAQEIEALTGVSRDSLINPRIVDLVDTRGGL